MPVKKTSAEVYEQIKLEGLLSKKRQEVYEILHLYGPMTGAQVAERMFMGGRKPASETVRNRITELRDRGCVEEVKEGPCPVTGRTVIWWATTDRLPVEPSKNKRSRVEKICRSIDILSYPELVEISAYIHKSLSRKTGKEQPTLF